MKRWVLPLIVILFFTYPGLGLATSNHDSNNGESSYSSEMPNMNMQEHNQMQTDSSIEHSNQQEGGSDSHSDVNSFTSGTDTDTHTSTNSSSEGGEHSHGQPVVETPPNYWVLGTFGAINAGFLLIGVWNKWFRRRVVQP